MYKSGLILEAIEKLLENKGGKLSNKVRVSCL